MSTFATYAASVQVYTCDISLHENNITKPRVYIVNTGTTPLTDFDIYYYFTTDGPEPVLDPYYVPCAGVTIETVPSGYRVKFSVSSANIAPGAVFPDYGGWSIGIHYSDWSLWNREDDYSFNNSNAFIPNSKVQLIIDGQSVYGSAPPSNTLLEIYNTLQDKSVTLSSAGEVFSTLKVLEHSAVQEDTSLVFEYQGGTKLSIGSQSIRVANVVRTYNLTSASAGDLEFQNWVYSANEAPAAIGSSLNSVTNGDLLLRGKISGLQTITAYVDGAVFERGPDGLFDIAYANIGSEGREIYEQGQTTGARSYYIKDHLGSTRVVLSDNGQTIEDVTAYQPYGKMVTLSTSATAEQVKIRDKFTGKELDNEGADANGVGGIGLFYFGKRFYDAEIGRWTSTDPAEQFWDSYNYCGSEPINAIDPDGAETYYNSDGSQNYVRQIQNFGDGVKYYDRGNGVWSPNWNEFSGQMLKNLGEMWCNPVAILGTIAGVLTLGIASIESRLVLINPTTLEGGVAANFNRFFSKIPANSKANASVQILEDGNYLFSATSPGKVPGSSALYQKWVNPQGETFNMLKTTFAPDGSIVHIKPK